MAEAACQTFYDVPEEVVRQMPDLFRFVDESQEEPPEEDAFPLHVVSLSENHANSDHRLENGEREEVKGASEPGLVLRGG